MLRNLMTKEMDNVKTWWMELGKAFRFGHGVCTTPSKFGGLVTTTCSCCMSTNNYIGPPFIFYLYCISKYLVIFIFIEVLIFIPTDCGEYRYLHRQLDTDSWKLDNASFSTGVLRKRTHRIEFVPFVVSRILQ